HSGAPCQTHSVVAVSDRMPPMAFGHPTAGTKEVVVAEEELVETGQDGPAKLSTGHSVLRVLKSVLSSFRLFHSLNSPSGLPPPAKCPVCNVRKPVCNVREPGG